MALNIAPEQDPAAEPSGSSFTDLFKGLLEPAPGLAERMFFTEQLSLLLETGTPLHGALIAIRSQLTNPKMIEVVDHLEEAVTEGNSFSQALAQFPQVFSGTYVKLVAAAEEGGFLDKVLIELVRMDEQREALRRTVSSALSYPGFLLAFSFAVIIFVLLVVFPKFADMFSSIRDDLPTSTLVLMNTSDFLINHYLVVLTVAAAGIGALIWWIRTPQGSYTLDRWKLGFVGLKAIFIQLYLIQSLRVIGLSLGNGVNITDALSSSREVVANKVFQKFLGEVEARVVEGSGFAVAFQEASFIPATVKQMITTGESTGNLARILSRVADYYERELDKKLAAFSRMIEPIMLIVMGGVVGLIVSSLILPIFQLSRAVG